MSTEEAKMLILQTENDELRSDVARLVRDLQQRDASLSAEKRKNVQFFNQLSASEAHNYHITGENRRLHSDLRAALSRFPRPQPSPPSPPPVSPPPASPPPASPPPATPPPAPRNPPPSPSHTPTTPSYTPTSPSYSPTGAPDNSPSSTDDDDACKEIHPPPRRVETVSISDSDNDGDETDVVPCTPGQESRPATVPSSLPALEPDVVVPPPRRSTRTAVRRLDFVAFANLPVSDYFPASPEPAHKRQRRE